MNLSEEDKLTVARARKIERFSCPSRFMWPKCSQGHLVFWSGLKDTIAGFKGLVAGEFDHMPEQAFYMVGTIEEATEKAQKLAAEAA